MDRSRLPKRNPLVHRFFSQTASGAKSLFPKQLQVHRFCFRASILFPKVHRFLFPQNISSCVDFVSEISRGVAPFLKISNSASSIDFV